MLIDEERKAIEWLKKADWFSARLYAATILYLIEKQSKEIEELKKENKEIREWKYIIDSPIDLEKLKELDLIKIKGKEYISKDKIKAKIEEVEQWELYNMKIPRLSTLDERLGAKIGIKYVLQSLLKKGIN